jgi:sulfatase maturation enzyme AslB (radical SAM superfamily)
MASPANIQTVDVVLTAGCNLRCGYCYQNDKKSRRMDWETLRAAIDLLFLSRRPEVRLLFIGGEPLLEFELIRRGVAYAAEARPPGLKVRYAIVTNGTLVREEQASFLAEHDFDAQLSFDGVPAAQSLRGDGTFAVLDRLLERLHADEPRFFDRLRVALTLLPETIPCLPDSIEYFIRRRVREISVSPVDNPRIGWRKEQIGEMDEAFARVFRTCVRHYRRTGAVPLVLFRRHRGDSQHYPQGRSMCGVGRGETLAVDVDGQVYGCVTFAESYQTFPTEFLRRRLSAMRMGGVASASFRDRLSAYPAATRAAEIFDRKADKYSAYGRCGECRYLRDCAVCPVSIGHIPGNDDPRRVPDFACAFNLVSLKYRARFPHQPDRREMLLGHAHVPSQMRQLRQRGDRAGPA